ncbi:MAG: hypothetical protein K8I02_01775, partial [Candidatus Methylomirabilis sp.]|nr:hypothetical protein [Deltaproteobacteria bacterium]
MPRLRRLLAAGSCLLAFSAALGSCTQRTHRPQVDVVRLSTFEGDPYAIGFQHGSQLSGEINQFYTEFLRNALLPFLNRSRASLVDVLTFYTTSDLYELPNFAPQLLLEGAKSMIDGIPSPRREAFLAELHGISDGSGLPFSDTMILNTFLDSVTSILNVNYILDGLENPRVQQINFDASLDGDGLDNDGDGTADEPNEHIFGVERRSSAFALAKGQPADRPIQVRIADTQLKCNRLIDPDPTCRSCEEGEEPFDPDTGKRVCFEPDLQFGEGIDLNKPRNPENPEERGLLRVNGVFLRRCMSDEADCDGYKDNGIETVEDGELTVTTPP